MMFGDLPPSSSVSGSSRSAALRITVRPVATLPVNVTLEIPGCATSAAPGLLAVPGDDVENARRQIALERDPRKLEATEGVSSAGLMTAVLPAASAGAIPRAA